MKVEININKKEFRCLRQFISDTMSEVKPALPFEVEEILRRVSNQTREKERALWNPGDPFDG